MKRLHNDVDSFPHSIALCKEKYLHCGSPAQRVMFTWLIEHCFSVHYLALDKVKNVWNIEGKLVDIT